LQSLRDEVAESRAQLRNADANLRDKDQQHMARLHRIEWLESQLNDKDEVNALVKRRLEQAEAHIRSLDKSWNQSREQTEKAESIAIEYANEIKKGNAVIERLANELKAVKSKSKLRSTVILQQEQLLEEQKIRLDKASEAKRQTEEEKDALIEETERVKLKLSERDRRVAELEDERASDGKMISWLNAQINDAQLRRSAQSDLEKFAF
jgi:chromosome segregation ATPase